MCCRGGQKAIPHHNEVSHRPPLGPWQSTLEPKGLLELQKWRFCWQGFSTWIFSGYGSEKYKVEHQDRCKVQSLVSHAAQKAWLWSHLLPGRPLTKGPDDNKAFGLWPCQKDLGLGTLDKNVVLDKRILHFILLTKELVFGPWQKDPTFHTLDKRVGLWQKDDPWQKGVALGKSVLHFTLLAKESVFDKKMALDKRMLSLTKGFPKFLQRVLVKRTCS